MRNHTRKLLQSKFTESAILGTAGLIAVTLGGVIVFTAGVILNLEYLSTPFTDELLMLVEFPMFFIIAALIKIVIGGKIIEFCVKYISRLLGIKRIIIDPDKPLIVVRDKSVKSPISRLIGIVERAKIDLGIAEKAVAKERAERSREKNRNVAIGLVAMLIFLSFLYFFASSETVSSNFVISMAVSTMVIYAATKLLGEKEGFGSAILAALVGSVVYTMVYYFLGNGLLASGIGGIAWLIALGGIYEIGWFKSLMITVMACVVVNILSFLPAVAGLL